MNCYDLYSLHLIEVDAICRFLSFNVERLRTTVMFNSALFSSSLFFITFLLLSVEHAHKEKMISVHTKQKSPYLTCIAFLCLIFN